MHIIIFYLLINIAAIVSLKFLTKFLLPIEIVGYLFLVSILAQDFFAIVYLNLEKIQVSDKLSYFLLIALNRAVLISVIVNWFITLFWSAASVIKKFLLLVLFTGILSLIEYTGDWLGLITHAKGWKVSWTMLEWFTILIIVMLFSLFFRRRVYSEVKL